MAASWIALPAACLLFLLLVAAAMVVDILFFSIDAAGAVLTPRTTAGLAVTSKLEILSELLFNYHFY